MLGIRNLIEGSDQLLAHQIADKTLLDGVDGTGQPEQGQLVQKGIDDLQHGALEADRPDIGGKDGLKLAFIQFHHRDGHGIHLHRILEIAGG